MMTRSIKDLREFINVSRLSFRDSDDSDNESPLYLETNDLESTNTLLDGEGLLTNERQLRNLEHTVRGVSNLDDVVIGRPASAIGARRPPSAKVPSSQRNHVRRKQKETAEKTRLGQTETHVAVDSEQQESLDTNISVTTAREYSDQTDHRLQEIFNYVDTVVIGSWLEKCNSYLDNITNWLKKNNNFIKFAHFMLSNLHHLKRRQLFELEISVILDELQFAFKVGISSKKIGLKDLTDLLSIVLREYPRKLYGSNGSVCILDIFCVLCCGKNESFKNLLSNVKYSTRNTQVAQWMLAIRAFGLLSICNGVLDFYQNVSEESMNSDTATSSEQSSFQDIRHYWLFASTEFNFTDVIQFLLRHLEFNASCVKDNQGRNLIFKSVMCGKEKILALLVEKVSPSIDINQCADSGNSPLHAAIAKGNINIISLLIKNGASVNQRNTKAEGSTPLHMAVMNGELKIVKLLVDHGADVNSKMGSLPSVTPIELAKELNHREILEYLRTC